MRDLMRRAVKRDCVLSQSGIRRSECRQAKLCSFFVSPVSRVFKSSSFQETRRDFHHFSLWLNPLWVEEPGTFQTPSLKSEKRNICGRWKKKSKRRDFCCISHVRKINRGNKLRTWYRSPQPPLEPLSGFDAVYLHFAKRERQKSGWENQTIFFF